MRNVYYVKQFLALFSTKLVALVSLLFLVMGLSGCGGGGGGGGGTTRATVTITSTSPGGAGVIASDTGFVSRGSENPVDPDDIESLTITITKIVLHRSAGDDDGDGEGEPEQLQKTRTHIDEEEGEDPGNRVTVFEGSEDVDLKNLEFFSEILTTANLPSGKYTKIVIHYENPRLVLVADPDTTIEDIHITANGRLFISQNFTLPPGAHLIVIDFGGLHLVETGDGTYVLTPQLRVDIDIENAEVEFDGIITVITPESSMIEVDDGENLRDVFVNDDTLYLRELPEAPPVVRGVVENNVEEIDFEDLMVDDLVEVEGVLQLDGSVVAHVIEVKLEEEVEVEPEV